MPTEVTLLPCPFCGDDPEMMYQMDDIKDYSVRCKCGASCGGIVYSKRKAADLWNRRADNLGQQKHLITAFINEVLSIHNESNYWLDKAITLREFLENRETINVN